jgi:hypothetical protein
MERWIGVFTGPPAIDFMFVNNSTPQRNVPHRLPCNWILLDNQSTVNVFSNRALLGNVGSRSRDGHPLQCGSHDRMMGDLPGYDGPVWYNPDGIANILSLSDVMNYHHVTFDSRSGGCFRVFKDDGNVREFAKSENGLFFMVAKNADDTARGTTLMVSGAIETVDNKKSNYTARSYSRAIAARKFQDQFGQPPLRTVLEIIDKNLVSDCPITN